MSESPPPTDVIFLRALELDGTERERYLDSVCRDPAVRRRVEKLLERQTDQADVSNQADIEAETDDLYPSIGDFSLVEVLEKDPHGTLYRARDTRLGRDVALRVLSPVSTSAGSLLEVVRRLASIKHPNVAAIYTLEDDPERPYFTMELVRGHDLTKSLGGRASDLRRGLRLARQIAAALEVSHDAGVLHLGLHPGCIQVVPPDRVKVLGFGGGRGRPGYSSPEQVRGEPADERSDVWSLGCVLFEIFAGRPAFPSEDAAGTAAQVTTSNATDELSAETVDGTEGAAESIEPEWTLLPEDLPDAIRNLLTRCMQPTAEDRPESVAAIRQAIDEQRIAVDRPVPTPPPSSKRDDTRPERIHLPRPLTTFVGRETELQEVRSRIVEQRLTSIVGPGGSGKTRLAIHAARESAATFPDGVWYVELSPLREGSQVDPHVAAALELGDHPNGSPRDLIRDYLASRRALVILDNCEHLLDDVASLTRAILESGTECSVLLTSREVLGVQGESAYRLPMLSEVASRDLFRERARSAAPDFQVQDSDLQVIDAICRKLDGIPLAVELAANRIRVLSPQQILERLENRFQLLRIARPAMERHQTLRAVLDWSYEQLAEDERRVFCRLSVFSGSWSLEAAEDVCDGDGVDGWDVFDIVGRLVDKSLVDLVVLPDGERGSRFRLLETMRDYGSAQLGDPDPWLLRHLHYYTDWAAKANLGLTGNEQAEWVQEVKVEHDNLRQAWITGERLEPTTSATIRMVAMIIGFGNLTGRWSEVRTTGERFLEVVRSNEDVGARDLAVLLNRLGVTTLNQSDLDASVRYHEWALSLFESIPGENATAGILNNMGLIAMRRGRYDEARELFLKAREQNRLTGNAAWESTNLSNLGLIEWETNHFEEAGRYFEGAIELAKDVGNLSYQASFTDNLALVAADMGDLDRAQTLHEESLALCRRIEDPAGESASLLNLGSIAMEKDGDAARAMTLVMEAVEIKAELGDIRGIILALETMTWLHESTAPEKAAYLLGAASAQRKVIDFPLAPADAARMEKSIERTIGHIGKETYAANRQRGERAEFADVLTFLRGTS